MNEIVPYPLSLLSLFLSAISILSVLSAIAILLIFKEAQGKIRKLRVLLSPFPSELLVCLYQLYCLFTIFLACWVKVRHFLCLSFMLRLNHWFTNALLKIYVLQTYRVSWTRFTLVLLVVCILNNSFQILVEFNLTIFFWRTKWFWWT